MIFFLKSGSFIGDSPRGLFGSVWILMGGLKIGVTFQKQISGITFPSKPF